MRIGVPFVGGLFHPKKEPFHTKDIDFISNDTYKCCMCGHESVILPVQWDKQSQCPECGGQMMSWEWFGWKDNPIRNRYVKAKDEIREIEGKLSVSQAGYNLSLFTRAERTIGYGVMVVEELPCEAPWMNGLGACNVKIYAIRRLR